jgi:hypothetical protein
VRCKAVQPLAMQLAPWQKLPTPLLVMLAVTSTLLTGCGGPTPEPSAPTTASSPRTTSAAPTPNSPTPATPTKDPNIPAAALAHTSAGAEAFVRYFYSQLNLAWSKPQAGLISRLSETTCKTCANFEREATKSVTKDERVVGQSIILGTVKTSDVTNPDKLTVVTIGHQPKTVVVNAKGNIVQELKQERVRTSVTVQWVDKAWRLREIQNLA